MYLIHQEIADIPGTLNMQHATPGLVRLSEYTDREFVRRIQYKRKNSAFLWMQNNVRM
jgi:hypothetical protein